MANEDKYVVGRFYWVWVAFDPDCDTDWENDTMPARFAGYDANGGETWNFLDSEPNDWAVRHVVEIADQDNRLRGLVGFNPSDQRLA